MEKKQGYQKQIFSNQKAGPGRGLASGILGVLFRKKMNILIIGVMPLYIFCFVCRKVVLAGISGFLPLVDVKVMNYYPVLFMGQIFNIMLTFLSIFYICAVYGTYLENKNIILPLFHGYTRKDIYRACCVGVAIFILFLFLACFVVIQAGGIPLEVLYLCNKEIFQQYGVFRAPLGVENFKLSLCYLICQYVSICPVLSLCILINTIFRRKVIAGGITGICYMIIQLFTMQFKGLGKLSCYFYQENFMNVSIKGDEVFLTYLAGGKEYLAGVLVCMLISVLLLKVGERCFVLTDF